MPTSGPATIARLPADLRAAHDWARSLPRQQDISDHDEPDAAIAATTARTATPLGDKPLIVISAGRLSWSERDRAAGTPSAAALQPPCSPRHSPRACRATADSSSPGQAFISFISTNHRWSSAPLRMYWRRPAAGRRDSSRSACVFPVTSDVFQGPDGGARACFLPLRGHEPPSDAPHRGKTRTVGAFLRDGRRRADGVGANVRSPRRRRRGRWPPGTSRSGCATSPPPVQRLTGRRSAGKGPARPSPSSTNVAVPGACTTSRALSSRPGVLARVAGPEHAGAVGRRRDARGRPLRVPALPVP